MASSPHTPPMRSALGRVRGHGSAKAGTGHFIAQRVSAIGLAILAPWFALAAALHGIATYEAAIAFLRTPLHAIGVILLVGAGVYHMSLGMQVIIEDYIQKHSSKLFLLILNNFACVALAAAGIFSVLRISLGA